jgi:hypothetical protein
MSLKAVRMLTLLEINVCVCAYRDYELDTSKGDHESLLASRYDTYFAARVS